MKSYCIICNREQNQTVVSEEKQNYYEEETTWWEESIFQIIQCGGCGEISFRKLYNDAAQDQNSNGEGTTQELYPKRDAHSRPIKPYKNIGHKLTTVYRETIDAYNSNLVLLCGVGLRAILEGICIDKGILGGKVKTLAGVEKTSKSLDGKIAGLAEKGFLTVHNAEILNELRFLGNDIVHGLYNPSLEELKLAIEIIELVLENIYEVGHKAIRLKERRSERKK